MGKGKGRKKKRKRKKDTERNGERRKGGENGKKGE